MKTAQSTSAFGPKVKPDGVEFSLYSERAKEVRLCLFSDDLSDEKQFSLKNVGEGKWKIFIPDVGFGQKYSYRVDGSWAPHHGLYFDLKNLLLDPYAKGVYSSSIAEVVSSDFNWKNTPLPKIPWSKTIVYETHVKGMSMLHPDVPEELRGTYLGLCSKPILNHLQKLRVTSVELLPVHLSISENHLIDRKLSNYWGYNTLSFFSPDPRFATATARYSPQAVLVEFQEMVKTFHQAGIEVILDVVYNHTAEGGGDGPIFSFRGIDNLTYYRHRDIAQEGQSHKVYEDVTGCGNTVKLSHPVVQRLVLDSLRYFAEECQVDGFRLDLSSALCRNDAGEFQEENPLFFAILSDPILSERKIIAEPWDATAEGYRLGGYPIGVSEWNDQYRDTIRRFWRGDEGLIPGFASALSGTSHLFSPKNRPPRSSINFVTAHDGFTLRDLVSYENPHNLENGEEGRDGAKVNYSSNCGVEGESKDKEIETLRRKQMRNFLSTLLLSLGTPMLLGGDELTRTQKGNNNSYCHDNETNWFDWTGAEEGTEFSELIAYLLELRNSLPVFQRESFFKGHLGPSGKKDIAWLGETGEEFTPEDWQNPALKSLQVYLSDSESPGRSESLLLMFNTSNSLRSFSIPSHLIETSWQLFLRTDERVPFLRPMKVREAETIELPPQTLFVFRSSARENF